LLNNVQTLAAPRWSSSLEPREVVVGNMPSDVDAFIGRDLELARLQQLQAETRLLTLVGPGGVGKTRLALRLESQLSGTFPDGSWLVDLSPIVDPALLPQALGDVLGVRQQPGQSMLGELTRQLRPRRLLLLLDNCEHLISACAEVVDGLLRSCPNLHVLATSIQPLGAAAETTWRVRPLSVPERAAADFQAVEASEAVRLFVARIRAHLPDFTLGEHNAEAIAEICRQLDGLPLALELVAARVESLGVDEVAARLGRRFELAVSTNRRVPARQRTLQAALDWSCSLLTARELVLLRRLAVFVGGWTLQAAEAVCSGDPLPPDSVVDVLGQLVSKSLVVVDRDEHSLRYHLLETVRTYAWGHLDVADETVELQRLHAKYLLRLAESAPLEMMDASVAATLRREEDNLRAALEWTIVQNQAETGLRLATAAFPMWMYSGHYLEGRNWFERLLELPAAGAAPAAHSRALTVDGQLFLLLGDYALANARGQLALAEHQLRGDTAAIGLTLMLLGNVAMQRGSLAEAGALHAEAARFMHESANPAEVASLLQLGQVEVELGDADQVMRHIAEVEAVGQTRQDSVLLGAAMHLRALLAAASGDVAAAARLLDEALALRGPDQQGIVKSLTALGHVRLELGQRAAALEAFADAMRRARASGERIRLIRSLEGVARWLAARDPSAAVRLAAATDGQRHVLGAELWPSERRFLDSWLGDARRALGPVAYEQAWEDGHASTLAQAFSLAEALTIEPDIDPSLSSALTPREQEVASLLGLGFTNRQIAAELVVTPATARSHVEHILDKLDLHSRAQIAVWASQHGLIPPARGE
jgi:predicted ATPase/DNA-binding CsgD family transcriptional regulator